MLHILCVGYAVCLVVGRHSVLCLLESPRVLLDDYEELHKVLISFSLHEPGGPLELAVKDGRALPNDERVRALLLHGSNILMPEE